MNHKLPTKLVPSNNEGIYEIINYYMQNKPNFQKAKMNITSAITNDYENISPTKICENKPNQTQFQYQICENKPNRTQFLYQIYAKQTQSNPISAQKRTWHLNQTPYLVVFYLSITCILPILTKEFSFSLSILYYLF